MASRRSLFAILAGGLALLAAPSSAGVPDMPQLKVTLLDGHAFDLAQQRGHVVVVNFWATWCPPCRAEMPAIDRFARAHPQVVVVGVSVDQKRDAKKVRQVMAPLGYPSVLLTGHDVNDFGEQRELPATYVIDRQGKVAARIAGGHPPLTEPVLEQAVSAAH